MASQSIQPAMCNQGSDTDGDSIVQHLDSEVLLWDLSNPNPPKYPPSDLVVSSKSLPAILRFTWAAFCYHPAQKGQPHRISSSDIKNNISQKDEESVDAMIELLKSRRRCLGRIRSLKNMKEWASNPPSLRKDLVDSYTQALEKERETLAATCRLYLAEMNPPLPTSPLVLVCKREMNIALPQISWAPFFPCPKDFPTGNLLTVENDWTQFFKLQAKAELAAVEKEEGDQSMDQSLDTTGTSETSEGMEGALEVLSQACSRGESSGGSPLRYSDEDLETAVRLLCWDKAIRKRARALYQKGATGGTYATLFGFKRE